MYKKLLVLLLCGAMLIAMLASCVNANEGEDSSTAANEEETNWGGVRLLHHYVKRFAPSKGEYTIELGYETPPSKDSPNPVYRLYYTVVDGEYVLYTGESSKDALYSVLKEQFDTPDVKWLSFDTVYEHEFFAGVTGNN